jgi:FkbM family methyltransferase
MGGLGRAFGLARSLAIYHAIPFRQRRLRRLYAEFVRADDLVLDIGAHAGNRTRAFAAIGCRVVALEPHPDFARLLRTAFARSPLVRVVEAAVGDAPGRATLHVSDRTPTVTTVAHTWRAARANDQGFAGVRWNRSVEVEVTTIDALVGQFGAPAFVKLDIEGAESAALRGLTRPVPALSFEYLPGAPGEVEACVRRLEILGPYRFNWSSGESYRLAERRWLDGDDLIARLRAPAAQRRSGDVYARLPASGAAAPAAESGATARR